MTSKELDDFLDSKHYIEWKLDDSSENPEEWFMVFRNTNLDWYNVDDGRGTKIMLSKLEEMTPLKVIEAVNKGLMVEGITRITGYFTVVRGWNPGKRGELRDRNRMSI